jgi:hypothetical protein
LETELPDLARYLPALAQSKKLNWDATERADIPANTQDEAWTSSGPVGRE